MKPKFSIITTCMGRLDHLKQTLPRLLEQADSEVVVVDYSCPQGTGDYVAEHFPAVKLVRVEGKKTFSNWAARNAGAAVAEGETLIFCDADTILRPDAMAWIGEHLAPETYGHFDRIGTVQFNTTRLRLGYNQLRGFHAVPADAFRKFGGYDDVMVGYAAGADTDLEVRLSMFGFKRMVLDPSLVEQVVEHGNEDRFRNHRVPIRTSYAAGYLYRKAKTAILRMRRKPNLPRPVRVQMYKTAFEAAQKLGGPDRTTKLRVEVDREAIGMPLQLGYKKAEAKVFVEVTITGTGPVEDIPTRIDDEAVVVPRKR